MPSKKLRQQLSKLQLNHLKVVAILSVALIQQVTDSLYNRRSPEGKGSYAPTSAELRKLYEAGYLIRGYHLKEDYEGGNLPYTYHLSTDGYKAVVTDHKLLSPFQVIYPSDNLKSMLTEHAIKSNAPIVWALQLSRRFRAISVDCRSERVLRTHKVTNDERSLIGDAWVGLRRLPTGDRAFMFEFDRGTIHTADWLPSRLRAYITLDGTPAYENYFGTKALVVCWFTKDAARQRALCETTLRHLQAMYRNNSDVFSLFRFGVYSERLTAEEFYFDPMWIEPGNPSPQSLLPDHWRTP